jgi:hypothetical protein
VGLYVAVTSRSFFLFKANKALFFLKFWIYFGFIQPYALKWFWDQKEWIHVEKQGISVLAIKENAEIDGFWASTAKVIHKLWVCGYSSLLENIRLQ